MTTQADFQEKVLGLLASMGIERPTVLVRTPDFPERLRSLTLNDVFDLYDAYLRSAHYSRSALTISSVLKSVAQESRKRVDAELLFQVKDDKRFSNADERKAGILLSPRSMEARDEELLYKSAFDAQQQRIDQISKSMRRIERELWYRTATNSPEPSMTTSSITSS